MDFWSFINTWNFPENNPCGQKSPRGKAQTTPEFVIVYKKKPDVYKFFLQIGTLCGPDASVTFMINQVRFPRDKVRTTHGFLVVPPEPKRETTGFKSPHDKSRTTHGFLVWSVGASLVNLLDFAVLKRNLSTVLPEKHKNLSQRKVSQRNVSSRDFSGRSIA